MLAFRGQFLDPVAQTAFTHRWGEVLHLPYLKQLEMPDHREVMAQGNLGKAKHALVTEQWHSDSSFMPAPPAHAILAAQMLPEALATLCLPTNTWRTKRYLRYEAPTHGATSMARGSETGHRTRIAIRLLREAILSYGRIRRPDAKDFMSTGLYTYCIERLTEAESRGLLDFCLSKTAARNLPIGICGHQAMSSCGTSLRATLRGHDFGEAPRVMHRTTIAGDVPARENPLLGPRLYRAIESLDE